MASLIVTINFFVFLLFAVAWSRKNWLNILIKFSLIILTIAQAGLVLELTNFVKFNF